MTKTNAKAKLARNAKSAPAAKAPKANPDTITTAVNVRGGQGGVLVEAGKQSMVLADWQINAETTKLAAKGQSFAALKAAVNKIAKPDSKLAKGVDSRNSPNSAKAVADLKRNGKGGSTAGEPGSKAKPAAKAKAKKTSGRGYDAAQKLTVLVKPKDSKLAEGSGRFAKLAFAAKCKTVGDFLGHVVTDASGKEHKCDAGALSGMLKREHVKLG